MNSNSSEVTLLVNSTQSQYPGKTKSPFVLVSDGPAWIAVLKSRLPHSSSVYNMVLMQPDLSEIEIFILQLDGQDPETAWILTKFPNKHTILFLSISTPTSPQITPEIKNAFRDHAPFEWDKIFWISVTHRAVSMMLAEQSTFQGNDTSIHPTMSFYHDDDLTTEIQQKEVSSSDPNDEVTLKPLEVDSGSIFLTKNYKPAKPGTVEYVRRMIQTQPSIGAYVKGQLVSGMITHCNGALGMLYTDPYHRKKGYASLCMTALCRSTLEIGRIPFSTVNYRNLISRAFHEKMMRMASLHDTDFIQVDQTAYSN